MTKIVFFDLDGTLLDNPSSEIQFFLFLLKNRHFGWKQFLDSCIFTFRWLWQFKHEIFIKNKAYFSGLSVIKISQLADQYTSSKLLPNIRPRIKKLLDIHLQRQDIVILLTGSPKFIANVIAMKLQVNELYATELHVDTDHFTKDPLLQHPYAQEKLKIAQAVCAKYKMTMSDATAYANSIHDYALLSNCGEAVAVTPDRKLRHLALANNWQVID